jgi:FKBP-type peptidyl-prolyl cis-trans isomerase
MRTTKTLLFVSVLFMLTAESCAQKKTAEGVTAAQIDSVSYALGVNLTPFLKQNKLEVVNLDAVVKGIQDALNEKASLDDRQAVEIIRGFINKRTELAKTQNLEAGIKFLADNKKNVDVVELPDGLQYKIITAGTGIKPAAIDTVRVKYSGTLIDGREFDSSDKSNGGEPIEFPLNGVIKGWTEGFQQFGEGTKAVLYIPASLAYGEQAPYGSIIEANSTLIFEVELLQVKPGTPTAVQGNELNIDE